MTDVTAPPAPTATHVGATGVTCCMVAGATRAAYLLNPTGTTTKTGELHVVDKAGVDKKIDTGVTSNGFGIAPGGKAIIYTKPAGARAALLWADLTAATVTPKTLFANNVYNSRLSYAGFFSPSGKYFVVGVMGGLTNSPDMHVIDTTTGTDVYQRLNGEFDYIEMALPDDTLIFQDTAGGTSTTSPPVQTLYWIALPNAATSTAATIATRTAQLLPTADNKQLIYLRTNGDLYAWDTTTKSGAGKLIASGAIKFAVGTSATGPIAYLGADRSVHAVSTDGTKLLDVAAAAANADPFGDLIVSPDGVDLFYLQNADAQNQRGTLMRVALQSGATPTKVGDNISRADVNIFDSSLLLLQNVDELGKFGDALVTARDGTNPRVLGTKVPVGGLAAAIPGLGSWIAMHLTASVDDTANTTIDGSPAIYGALTFEDDQGGAAVALDPKVHAGTLGFAADDARTAAFVSGATFNATAGNYVGALKLFAVRLPSMVVDGKVTGCSEVGPIVARGLFVNAPTASPAGVYYISF
jgi:hypothetical protein